MKRIVIALTVLLTAVVSSAAQNVNCIWDKAYSAFPSIVKFQGKYYVSFREGESHIYDSYGNAAGKARILVSEDGEKWESAALLAKAGYDLRDPKLSVTPDGRLMVVMGGSIYVDRTMYNQIPQVSFSSDGKNFTEPQAAKFEGLEYPRHGWLWRVTWKDGVGYGVFYANPRESKFSEDLALVKTVDGVNYTLLTRLAVPDFPGETTVRFLKDGRMALMVRRELGDKMGWWGVSEAPYSDWAWTPMSLHLGGPDFIVLNDDKIIAGTRLYGQECQTAVLKGNATGKFDLVKTLPSGGDTSYPGFIVVGDQLWMVYYSSHETGKAAIYLAKMPLSDF